MEQYSQSLELQFVKSIKSGGFCALSLGGKGTGKSSTALALIRKFLTLGTYKNYFLVLPNYKNEQNDSYSWLKDYHNKNGIKIYIYDHYDPIVAEHVSKADPKVRNLFLLDDLTGSGNFQYIHNDMALKNLVASCRHHNLLVWFISHGLKMILNPVIRDNISYLFLYSVSSASQLKQIHEIYMSIELSYKEFFELYKEHAERPYGCMLMFLEKNKKIDFYSLDWSIIADSLKKNLSLQNKSNK